MPAPGAFWHTSTGSTLRKNHTAFLRSRLNQTEEVPSAESLRQAESQRRLDRDVYLESSTTSYKSAWQLGAERLAERPGMVDFVVTAAAVDGIAGEAMTQPPRPATPKSLAVR